MRLLGTKLGSISTGRGLGDPLYDTAAAVPSLDLQFAERKSLVDAVSGQNLITFTRSSNGTYVDSQGVLQTAATNEPRFDHNPTTGECLGLLVEEQRTNSIRNNTMVGAVAGTPGTLPTNWSIGGSGLGTLTQQIVGTGSVDGTSYIDFRLSGTTSTTDTAVAIEQPTIIAAATGQSWTQGGWFSIVSGSKSNITSIILNVVERTSAGGAVTQQNLNILPTLTSSLTRITAPCTLSGGATVAYVQPRLLFGFSSGAAIDITLRIGMPQLEQGSFATSVIPTTGTAATRNADVADIINTAIANGIRTLYAEFRSPASGIRGVVSLNDNTANERAAINTSGVDPRLVVVDGGVTQADIDDGTIVASARSRMAVRISANNFAASFNGGAVVTDTSGTLPTVDRLFIGRTQAGEYLNAPIARIVGWREELPDSTLQALTQS